MLDETGVLSAAGGRDVALVRQIAQGFPGQISDRAVCFLLRREFWNRFIVSDFNVWLASAQESDQG